MNSHFLIYHNSGEIIGHISCPQDSARDQRAPKDHGLFQVSKRPDIVLSDKSSFYVFKSKLRKRRKQNLILSKLEIKADSKDEVVISGFSGGEIVSISGIVKSGPHEIEHSELFITSNRPGKIIVTVTCYPHFLPWTCEINAT